MAQEKIEDVGTDILLKRKKFITFLVGVFIGIGLVMAVLIIYDLAQDKEIARTTLSGAVASLCCFWIPLFMLGKVNNELKRRKELEDHKPLSTD